MKYEILQASLISGETYYFIQVDNGDFVTSFSIDNSNPSYISFLRQLSEENPNDPHYLAWVEAGNNPEDFWVQEQQADALVEQPKEEGEG